MPDIQQAVREKYGAIASSVTEASSNPGCCGPIACGCGDPITSNRYSDAENERPPGRSGDRVAGMRQSAMCAGLPDRHLQQGSVLRIRSPRTHHV